MKISWMKLYQIVWALLLLASVVQSSEAQLPLPSQPWQSYSVPAYDSAPMNAESAAFYYPWYCGSNWDGRLLEMLPAKGRYDNRQSAIIEQHMVWAKRAGLSSLIVSWWGRNNDRGKRIEALMPALLDAAGRNGLKIIVMIELYSNRTPALVADDIRSCVARYGSHPAFYKSSRQTPWLGSTMKPVFFIDRVSSYDTFDPDYWTDAVRAIHANSNAVVLADEFNTAWADSANFGGAEFDGLWDYSYTNYWDVLNAAHRVSPLTWYVPTTCPGFDARRSKNWARVIPRSNGAYYAFSWNKVLQSNINTPLVTVTSFNEWFETTQIEPCSIGKDRDGFSYETYADNERSRRDASTSYLDLTAMWSQRLAAVHAIDFRTAGEASIQLGAVNQSLGVYQYDWGSDANSEGVTVGGKPARRALNSGSNRYLYLQVNKQFLTGLPQALQVRVDFFDSGTGNVYVQYSGAVSAYQTSMKVAMTNTNTWRTAMITLPDAVLNGRMNGFSDLRLAASTGLRPAFNLVVIKKLP